MAYRRRVILWKDRCQIQWLIDMNRRELTIISISPTNKDCEYTPAGVDPGFVGNIGQLIKQQTDTESGVWNLTIYLPYFDNFRYKL